ncbi:TPA: mannose-6-phosphate isomerase, class I [Vibrio harveyi]|nr:mannose-6-phosphate isomerase, class I [Vibrio harveyi]
MSLHRLNNVIQNYAWGSKSAITQLFGIANPKNEPQAELWMGVHPNGCSRLASTDQLLSEFVAQNKTKVLGEYTANRFGDLPYLFKILAANTPLSIQVHPNKSKAELGFERENAQGIELNATERNYKDPNHKPELVYALTFYKAMNGFRPIEQILSLFKEANITTLNTEVAILEAESNDRGLQTFFSALMTLSGAKKEAALNELYAACERPEKTAILCEALEYSLEFRKQYANDVGLFAPLYLNVVELAPGEAMFLHAGTPHAYVHGAGLEIMANSDNVLRAGLTPKFIDVPELIGNTIFKPIQPENIKLPPIYKDNKKCYLVPVDDFGFEILVSNLKLKTQFVRSAEIVFCIEGEITVTVNEESLILNPGESAFVTNDSQAFRYQGEGTLARVFN